MSVLRIIAPVIASTALGVAGFAAVSAPAVSAPVASSPAAAVSAGTSLGATVDQCRLRIEKVRVLDLQHDVDGVDQAFLNIGNSVTATRSYSIPQTRNLLNDGDELFADEARVELRVEILGGGGPSFSVGSDTVPCQDTTRDFVFDNGDARYKVKALVQVLP